MDIWGFDIIIDDIVFSDGMTQMGVLGGGGPQAAFGMRLWSNSVGLCASVGPDLPEFVLPWLKQMGISTQGILAGEQPTPRAWQILEADGRRIQIWRIPPSAVASHLTHRVHRLPGIAAEQGCHFGVDPLDVEFDFIEELKQLGALVSIETYTSASRRLSPDEISRLVSCADVFSMNLEEAHSIFGSDHPERIVQLTLEAGVNIVSLRLGEAGSVVADGATGACWLIPAVNVEVVNPIGAGNAYCGGLLAGLINGDSLQDSAVRGAVSASFIVEHAGIPFLTPEIYEVAEKRFIEVRKMIEPIILY